MQARLVYAQPTAGLAEIEPSMEWNPSVVSGVGVVADVSRLYADMHSYLSASGARALREGPTPHSLESESGVHGVAWPQLPALRHGMAGRRNSHITHLAQMRACHGAAPRPQRMRPGAASARQATFNAVPERCPSSSWRSWRSCAQ